MTEQGGTLRIRLTREKALALAADAAFVELMTNIDPAFADRAEVAHTIAVLEGR